MRENRTQSKNSKARREKPHVTAAHDVVISVDGQQVAAQYRNGSVVFTTSGPVSFVELKSAVDGLMVLARRMMGEG